MFKSDLGQPLLPSCDFPFTRGLALRPLSLELIRESLLSGLLCLCLVNALHEHSLVLEHVSFHFHVHCVVHVLVNLFGFPVLAQQAPENTHPAHPKDLGGEPGLPGTPPLTCRAIRLAYIAGLEKTEISDMNSNGNEESK